MNMVKMAFIKTTAHVGVFSPTVLAFDPTGAANTFKTTVVGVVGALVVALVLIKILKNMGELNFTKIAITVIVGFFVYWIITDFETIAPQVAQFFKNLFGV